jgi:small neutral amino acid transporter SnatA (MarC family)
MSFAFMVTAFLATANAGRVALAAQASRPVLRELALALGLALAAVAVAALVAGDLLDRLSISPPSFRLAAGIVLLAAGLRRFVWPREGDGPFAAVLITPDIVVLALSFGADEGAGRTIAAVLPALALAAAAYRLRSHTGAAVAARFLAALEIVLGVALGVNGIRDV